MIAAMAQSGTRDKEGLSLMEVLCPFKLLYRGGVERLAAECEERVRWVGEGKGNSL